MEDTVEEINSWLGESEDQISLMEEREVKITEAEKKNE